jgi:nicotinamide mononucleotide transporter
MSTTLPIEIIAVITGLLAVYYSINQSMLLWISGLISEVTYFIIFVKLRLFGDAFLQTVFLATTLYGWYKWKVGQTVVHKLVVTSLTIKQSVYVFLASLMIFFLSAYCLKHYTNDTVPYLDALITTLSITAQILLCYKIRETWVYWILTNFFSVGIYAYKGIYLSSFLYFVFLIMAIEGLRKWSKETKRVTHSVMA